MKLKVFDRILLAILLIVAILSAVVLFAMALNIVTFDMATAFISQFYAVRQNMLILAGSGLILLLISLKLLFANRGEKKSRGPVSASVRKSEIGGTFIALSAIETMVKKFCDTQESVRDCQSTIRATDTGVSIGLKLSLLSDTDVVTVTQELQKALKDHVETLTGVAVNEVSILVENASIGKSGVPAVAAASDPNPTMGNE